jgi:hypothetical protein
MCKTTSRQQQSAGGRLLTGRSLHSYSRFMIVRREGESQSQLLRIFSSPPRRPQDHLCDACVLPLTHTAPTSHTTFPPTAQLLEYLGHPTHTPAQTHANALLNVDVVKLLSSNDRAQTLRLRQAVKVWRVPPFCLAIH